MVLNQKNQTFRDMLGDLPSKSKDSMGFAINRTTKPDAPLYAIDPQEWDTGEHKYPARDGAWTFWKTKLFHTTAILSTPLFSFWRMSIQ